MANASEKIAIAILQKAIKDPIARIPSDFQTAYDNYQKQLNLKNLLQINLLAQAAYLLYTLVDLLVLSDVGTWLLYSKMVYALSMTVLSLVLYRYYQNLKVFDLLLPYSIVGASVLWFYNLNLSESIYTPIYQYASLVFVVLANLGVQMRFQAAFIPSILISVVSYIGVSFNTQHDTYQILLFSIIYLPILFFSLYISWAATLKSRILFLHHTLADIHYQASERLANTDALTGLSNRRAFEHIANHYIQQNKLSPEPMALLVFDVDFFKNINDSYGHDFGDQVLQHIAEVAYNFTRARDVLARFGGEEFIILLPNTELKDAYRIAERLRVAIEQSNVYLSHAKFINFTISIGIAEIRPECRELRQVFSQADAALYNAKKRGRNRTCLANVA